MERGRVEHERKVRNWLEGTLALEFGLREVVI